MPKGQVVEDLLVRSRQRRWPWFASGAVLSAITFVLTFFGPGAVAACVLVASAAAGGALIAAGGRSTLLRIAALFAIAVALNIVLVIIGVPGVRGSIWELNRVAEKINSCAPGAASVDMWRGGIVTIGEPTNGPNQLTPDEHRLILANGKVELCIPAIS